MSERTIGTCSICGGAVTVPLFWLGVHPPTPSCSACGATPVHAHGPVIPMRPRQPSWSPSWQSIPTMRPAIPTHEYNPFADPMLPVDYDSTGYPFHWPQRTTTIS